MATRLKNNFQYDVTVSFAGEDRPTVERLVQLLRRNGVRVFYDAWEQADLWGKDLYQHLDTIYRSAARYCLIFVSDHYIKKAWTKHELKSAQARAFKENSEYILPIRLDDAEVPGLPPTVAYVDARTTQLPEICRMVVSKLGMYLKSDDREDRIKELTEYEQSELGSNKMTDDEFKSMLYSLREKIPSLMKLPDNVSRVDFLGAMQKWEKLSDVEDYLFRNYPDRFL